MATEHLTTIQQQFERDLTAASTREAVEEIRIRYLGRQGIIADLMTQLKSMSSEDKRTFGPQYNALKHTLHDSIEKTLVALSEQEFKTRDEASKGFDVTAYKPGHERGTLHPYTHAIREIEKIFTTMGFEIIEGPEVETEAINFTALNIPEDHPARDMHDTFWLDIPGMLMRTHTSSVQVHTMQNQRPPIAAVAPGRCYRHEATDASHDFMFMQCEGMFIDKNVSMANLFAVTKTFLQAIFESKDINIRTRPSYFPFVEPGVEIDMTCPFCTNGCSTCKKTGWIELCGAGLIHPKVLEAAGIDPKEYTGFAFGFGLTRLVMIKYGISDIRLLHEGRLDFLKQF